MKTSHLKNLAFAILGLPLAGTLAQAQDLTAKLTARNEFRLLTAEVKPYLFDENVQRRLYFWLNHEATRPYVVDCQMNLRPFFQEPKVLGAACYLLRQASSGERHQALKVLEFYRQEMRLALGELSDDPRFASDARMRASGLKVAFDRADAPVIEKCFEPALKAQYPKDGSYEFSPFTFVRQCLNESLPQVTRAKGGKVAYVGLNLQEEFPAPIHPGHAISETGWVGGNQIQYLTTNDTSEKAVRALEPLATLVAKHYPLAGAGSVAAMREVVAAGKQPFTEAEGFPTMDNHPTWSQPSGIFREIRTGVESAKSTIFIDIFFLGGSMGAALAKHIVTLAEKKNLKVVILRDNINHFGHEPEMRPIYNYLQAYSELHPERMAVAGAHIQEHRSGLPKLLWNVVTDDLIAHLGLQKHLALYGRAQSDHSKVFVIDGKTANPVAFVGSKNLTDSSGGACYDEVVKVIGPGAAVVQDDYYEDMKVAFAHEYTSAQLKQMGRANWKPLPQTGMLEKLTNAMKDLSESFDTAKGHANLADPETAAAIATLLKPFDLLDRDANGHASPTARVMVSDVGSSALRTGFNSWDSTRTNIVDENVQAILSAKKRILMKDQFLFDRNLVLALIEAKVRNPKLDVRVILEPLHAATPHGMPNLLYYDLLKQAEIPVKVKKIVASEVIAQEYHMKTISVDGINVISGSANKDQTTMYGSFREEQIDVMDAAAAKEHDRVFEAHWSNPAETEEVFSQLDFPVPGGLKGVDGKPLTPVEFIALVRNLLAVVFDARVLD